MKKKVKYNKSSIDQLPNDKPVLYKIKTNSKKLNYVGVAKRSRVIERIKEHLDEIPGATVSVEQFSSINDAKNKETTLDINEVAEQKISVAHNRELMRMAREALAGKWGTATGATFLLFLIVIITSAIPIIGLLIVYLFLLGPFKFGFSKFYLSVIRKQEVKIGLIFSGFNEFWNCFAANFMITFFIFLWSLLLVIPGIIAAFSYAMTFFIIVDNPEIGVLEAIKQSKKIMYGNRWKLFCLGWRFFGGFFFVF